MILQFLKKEVKIRKKLMIAYSIVSIGILLLQLFIPYMSGRYIDSLVQKHSKILVFVIAIVWINIISFMMEYCMTFLSTKLNNTFLYRICNHIFQKIYTSSFSFIQGKDTATLTDQITGDAATISSFFLSTVLDILYDMIVILVSIVVLFQADMLLGSCILVSIPFYFFVYKKIECKMYENEKEYKQSANDYTSRGMEQIRCERFVKQNSIAIEMEERFKKSFHNLLFTAIRQVKTEYLFSNLNGMIMIICYVFVLAIGGYKVEHGMMSIGYFTMIQSYLNMVVSSVSEMIEFSESIPKVKVAIDRINTILEYEDCNQEIESNNNVFRENKIETITLKNVTVFFQNRIIFQNFYAKFEKGKIYGIVGENGTGKSTLLDLIIGLYRDSYTGNILYNDLDIKSMNMELIRREEIAFLGQQSERISFSIGEYLDFGIENKFTNKEQHIIQELFQNTIHNRKEEMITHCSGGEFQKLSLIRIFKKEHTVMILDEPTTGLDMDAVQFVLHRIQKEKDKHITIIVSHDKRVLDICDTVIQF